ncbi:MAG: bifunctional oligoribonuclease/PAP phosphatase NrnA [Clostridia bacterium]|nr:bifunctional oligoribonuclease/PAP phosphatase NrnA [Clostridia bacterium]
MSKLSFIASYLQERDDYTIICHVSPDGDTLGSGLALYGALQKLKKSVQIVCEDALPKVYAFLPFSGALKKPAEAAQTRNVISVDCAARDRLGTAETLFANARHTLNIDHHVTNAEYADDNCVWDTAAAGEIFFDLLEMMGLIDPDIATCLYTAIMTDTGNFAYSNTSPETLHAAAELIEDGADNAYINRCVYRTMPFSKVRLLGYALAHIELYCNGRLGLSRITRQDFEDAGATCEDVEGIIDHIRDVDTVEIAVLVRESAEAGACKVSLRSKTSLDVGDVAARMNGGGHKRAAGYTDHGTLDEVCARALQMAGALLSGE